MATSRALSPAWLDTVRALDSRGETDLALKEVSRACQDAKEQRAFATLDQALRTVEPASQSATVLVGLLRCTFAVRELLPAWPELLERVRSDLAGRGRNPHLLLRGLA